jgi:putative hydrolase of the HAD superfamily
MNSDRFPGGILIDLDDTLVNEAGRMQECWDETCVWASERLGILSPERLFEAIAVERDWFWSDSGRHREGRLDLRVATARIIGKALDGLGAGDEAFAREMANRYRDLREERLELFPGTVEALETLRGRGARLAMLTNGAREPQWAKIRRFDLARHFECIVVEGEFGAGKPERRVYEHALATLRVTPDDAWSVGDSLENDVGGPQALGVYGIWHDHRREGLPLDATVQPDRIVHSLGELVEG